MVAASNFSPIYRSFVVKLPLAWYAKPKILTADKISKYICFINEGNEVNVVQTTIEYNFDDLLKSSTKLSYLYSRNKTTIELNNSMFKQKLKLQDPNKFRIEKDRYLLTDYNKCYLDIYKDKLTGLGILKRGLDRYYDNLTLPPYFKYVKEITNDKRFMTYSLSSLQSITELGLPND
jgi:hypothetical protein